MKSNLFDSIRNTFIYYGGQLNQDTRNRVCHHWTTRGKVFVFQNFDHFVLFWRSSLFLFDYIQMSLFVILSGHFFRKYGYTFEIQQHSGVSVAECIRLKIKSSIKWSRVGARVYANWLSGGSSMLRLLTRWHGKLCYPIMQNYVHGCIPHIVLVPPRINGYSTIDSERSCQNAKHWRLQRSLPDQSSVLEAPMWSRG